MGYVSGLVVACGVVAVDDEDHGVDLRHVVPPELPHRRVAAEVERLERHSAELLCKRWGQRRQSGAPGAWGGAHEILDVGALGRDETVDPARLEPVEQRRLARVVQPWGAGSRARGDETVRQCGVPVLVGAAGAGRTSSGAPRMRTRASLLPKPSDESSAQNQPNIRCSAGLRRAAAAPPRTAPPQTPHPESGARAARWWVCSALGCSSAATGPCGPPPHQPGRATRAAPLLYGRAAAPRPEDGGSMDRSMRHF